MSLLALLYTRAHKLQANPSLHMNETTRGASSGLTLMHDDNPQKENGCSPKRDGEPPDWSHAVIGDGISVNWGSP
jgi:hypothetical protein